MRRTQSVLLVLIAVLSQSAYADDGQEPIENPDMRDHALSVGLFFGGFFASANHEFYDPATSTQKELGAIAADLGLRVGYLPMPYVGAEAEANFVYSGVDGSDSASLMGFRAHVIGQYPLEPVTPYAVAGLGVMGVSSDDSVLGADADLMSYLGAGAKYRIKNEWVARADLRLIGAPEANSFGGVTAHWELFFGLSYDIGAKSEPTIAEAVEVETPEPVAAVDEDGDGLIEGDECPGAPETINSYKDEDGCPDEAPDTDGDGISDPLDSCKDLAEDKDAFEDEDGCPEEDNDKDGVVDGSDSCPIVAGPLENRGCPDTDRDEDTVVDRLDNCPDEKGSVENHGCEKEQLVVIAKDRLEILDQVYFRTQQASIQSRSHRLLDNLAEVIVSHPEIEKVEIAGHTDDRGPDEKNRALSQYRAEAVARYLVSKGVKPSRLSPIGYGESQPAVEGTDAAAREANRRVEFKIITK